MVEHRRSGGRAIWASAFVGWLLLSAFSVGSLQHWHRRERQVMEDQAYSLVHALANTLRTMSGPMLHSETALQEVFTQIAATPSISGVALVTAEAEIVSGVGIPMDSVGAVDQAPRGSIFLERDILVWDTVNVGTCGRLAPGQRGWRGGREEATTATRSESAPPARLFVSLPLATLHARWRRDTLAVGVFCMVAFGAALGVVRLWGLSRRSAEYSSRLRLAVEETRALREMNLVAAGLAHEIKNPLNTVRGTAQHLAEHSGETREATLAADAIVQEIDRVSSRIDELLQFAKPRVPVLAAVSVGGLCAELAVLLADEMTDAGLTLRGPAAPVAVQADREQLRQVLFNLLHNAIRFAPQSGEIDVQVCPAADGTVTLTVRDHGPGVPESARDDIFSPYCTTSGEGSGLGLAIARRICRAHGWRISCPGTDGGAAFEIAGIAPAGAEAIPQTRDTG